MARAHDVPVAPNAVQGWELRWLLTLLLAEQGGVMTISELVARIESAGYSFIRRPSQAVSDALRAEIGKGRVRRVARGRYAFVAMSPSTARRFRARARRVREMRAFAVEHVPGFVVPVDRRGR